MSPDQPTDPTALDVPSETDAVVAPGAGAAPVAPLDPGAVNAVVPSRTPVPLLTWLGLAVGGLVIGSLGALVQADRRVVGGHTVWWGLVLVVVVLGVCVRAASYLVGDRRGGALVAVGWLVPTLVLAGSGPGGDVILPSTDRSTWYLGSSAVVALVALLWPLARGTRELAAERRGAVRQRRDRPALEPVADDEA